MKKFSAILAVLLVVLMLAGSALANEGVSIKADYANGKLSWSLKDVCPAYTIYVDGEHLIDHVKSEGSYKIDLDTTVDHVVKVVCMMGHTDTDTIKASKPVVTAAPSAEPTAEPTAVPTAEPTAVPTAEPTAEPTAVPTAEPTAVPTAEPTAVPTAEPTAEPTAVPTAEPTEEPTKAPVVTEAPVEDDDDNADDVPKTGDNTASYVIAMVGMMMAAAYLVSRRFARAK